MAFDDDFDLWQFWVPFFGHYPILFSFCREANVLYGGGSRAVCTGKLEIISALQLASLVGPNSGALNR